MIETLVSENNLGLFEKVLRRVSREKESDSSRRVPVGQLLHFDLLYLPVRYNRPRFLEYMLSSFDLSGDYSQLLNRVICLHRVLITAIILKYVPIDPSDHSPLVLATLNGDLEIVQTLLRDSSIDPVGEKNDPLVWACRVGQSEVIRAIISKGVDPSFPDNRPLEVAASKGRVEIVNLLLQDARVRASPLYPAIQKARHNQYLDVAQVIYYYFNRSPLFQESRS